jgi:hypothetical protein
MVARSILASAGESETTAPFHPEDAKRFCERSGFASSSIDLMTLPITAADRDRGPSSNTCAAPSRW